MELYIIRHAQSYNNALANQADRVADPPLTDLGRTQASRLAHQLASERHPEQLHGREPEDTHVETIRGYGIRRLYCSAMRRSLETATAVGEATGLVPEVWIDVHESGGIFLDHRDERGVVGYPGMTRSEITEQFPSVMPCDVSEDGWWDPARGEEDWPACHGRAVRVVGRLWEWASEGADNPIAIISHGDFIQALLKAILGRIPARNITFYHYNTAITRVDLEPADSILVRYVNRVPHLTQDLVS